MQPPSSDEFVVGKALSGFVGGYHARYSEYKNALSRVHGHFQNGGSLSYWVAPFDPKYHSFVNPDNTELLSLNSMEIYKTRPSQVDSIFAVKYNGDSITDNFLCHYAYQCRKVSNMSVYGIPSLQ